MDSLNLRPTTLAKKVLMKVNDIKEKKCNLLLSCQSYAVIQSHWHIPQAFCYTKVLIWSQLGQGNQRNGVSEQLCELQQWKLQVSAWLPASQLALQRNLPDMWPDFTAAFFFKLTFEHVGGPQMLTGVSLNTTLNYKFMASYPGYSTTWV